MQLLKGCHLKQHSRVHGGDLELLNAHTGRTCSRDSWDSLCRPPLPLATPLKNSHPCSSSVEHCSFSQNGLSQLQVVSAVHVTVLFMRQLRTMRRHATLVMGCPLTRSGICGRSVWKQLVCMGWEGNELLEESCQLQLMRLLILSTSLCCTSLYCEQVRQLLCSQHSDSCTSVWSWMI